MTTIQVTLDGDKELASKPRSFAGSSLDLTNSMGGIGLYLTNFFSGEVFASRGQVFGKPWPALNPNYAAFKARAFHGRPPLIRTGLMQKSFKHKSTSLTTSLWNEAEGWGVPERVMMLIDQQRELRVVQFIVADLTTQMDKAGLI